MKVSLNWLNEYFSEKINHHDLVEKFNLMSQEVSGLEKLLDIEGLVIGHVKAMAKHVDADKLNVCQVDVGDEVLQIICGAPNVDVNQKVIVAKIGCVLPGNFKIKRAKIRGVESHGMICSLAELGLQEFDMDEKGIYVLDANALVGKDPLDFLGLNDYVFELDLTANRSDLLSVRGIAYDTACLLDYELLLKEPEVSRENRENPVNVYTKTRGSSCYYGQLLENIKIKESPYWMKSRLIASGIRPINNVVDITNYVMLEYGQPLHAFDYDKIGTDRIIVRRALTGEKIVTLDGETRELLDSDLVITDGEKPIALAGVMGGLDTEIDESSCKVLLESAVFDPVRVRRTAARLNLKSESSTRFEKGIDSTKTLEALNRALELLVQYADALVIGKPSFYNQVSTDEKVIRITLEKLNQVTGSTYNLAEVEDVFRRLRFKYRLRNDEFKVYIPHRRPMESYQDLIEEIVRIHGYDKIGITLPVTPTQGGLNEKQRFRRKVREYFVGKGFFETKTYSLVTEEMAVKFDNKALETIRIMNPLTKEREYLRHSQLPSLIHVLTYNQSRKIDDVMIFEMGKGYFVDEEVEKLSFLLKGRLNSSLWQKDLGKVDFYLLKGLIETLLKSLKISNYEFIVPEVLQANLHPGISANLVIAGVTVGYLGKLHPEEEHKLGINDIFVSELDLDQLFKASENKNITYKEVSKYPSIKRDLALLVRKEISGKDLIETINKINKSILKNVEIFDVYEDSTMENELSIALSLEFSRNDRTLETKEVDEAIEKILNKLKEDLNITIRG